MKSEEEDERMQQQQKQQQHKTNAHPTPGAGAGAYRRSALPANARSRFSVSSIPTSRSDDARSRSITCAIDGVRSRARFCAYCTPAAAFVARQTAHRKTQQAAIEKQFKTKQAQEAHVTKAREKYEADCLRINGLTAQATLVQGKDLEKIQRQLERTQQTVGANEKDFANFARILQDTTVKWEQEWKAYCDGCQDLEEERMEFTKDNVWAYANAVSMVCVSDDESCERLRLALEQFEPEKDHENFIRDYGTGNAIPEPPQFINHSIVGASLPSSPSKPVTRPAQFVRSSQRMRLQNTQPPPPPQDDEPVVNTAGIGAGGNAGLNRAQTQSRGSSRAQAQAQAQAYGHVNGNGTASPQAVSSRPGTSHGAEPGQMVDPTTHRTMLVVGDNAYDVDPNKHAQQQQLQGSVGNRASVNGAPKPGDESDPLAQQMANLQRAANNTTIGRSGTRKGTMDSANIPPSLASPSKALTPPTSVSPAHQNRDYRNSAELVVGAYPVQPGSSRPSSPNPPTASFMKPPTQPSAPVVDSTIADYHQRFPEERGQRRSRSNSRASWNGQPPPQHPQQQQLQQQQQQLQQTPQRQHSHGQSLDRPVSREGHAGIGANGRSPSPSLRHPSMQPPATSPTRSVSPAAAQQADRRESYRSQRAVSSNSVGIALDPTGKVAMDSMADQYMQQQRQQQQQAPPPVQQQPQQPPYQQHMHIGQCTLEQPLMILHGPRR
ncbi:hypothetical protein EWM64_g3754 [Hericium alpestre]|uniref:F-BAR domain-containing protein n=1 Tax=Hericium alpestre TaxID=135208 RepID=A0A4Z0A1B3_9AGAM|nr:hypothetical protein EWM64_g3754 [Hericium alpestre]